MSLTIGDTAPDFEAETTEGPIKFHDWIGDSWAVLFSHPRDFTPVCTTELGYMARIKPDFDKRNVKIIGVSVDPSENHEQWVKDIEETQGATVNYPLIADTDFNVAKSYGMLPADVYGDPTERTPAQNSTLRNVFVIGPDKKIKLILVYPMTTGRNFDEVLRVIDSLQLTAEPPGRHARPVEPGRGRHHRRLRLERAGEGALSGRLGGAEALHPDRPGPGPPLAITASRRLSACRRDAPLQADRPRRGRRARAPRRDDHGRRLRAGRQAGRARGAAARAPRGDGAHGHLQQRRRAGQGARPPARGGPDREGDRLVLHEQPRRGGRARRGPAGGGAPPPGHDGGGDPRGRRGDRRVLRPHRRRHAPRRGQGDARVRRRGAPAPARAARRRRARCAPAAPTSSATSSTTRPRATSTPTWRPPPTS